MTTFECLIQGETPRLIAVADKPLLQGGKITHLTLQEFERQFNCTYREIIIKDTATKITPFQESITGTLSSAKLKQQVEKVIKSACTSLVICNMGEFGHGVFTSTPIPKDTVIAFYAGTITTTGRFTERDDQALGYYGSEICLSTMHHRGIACFFQHLPEIPKFPDAKTCSRVLKMLGQDVSEVKMKLNVEFFRTEFDEMVKESVAAENIRSEYLNYNGIPLIAFVTNRDLQQGEPVGFNYGYGYWLSRGTTPEFFDKSGCAVSWNLYRRTFGQLNFDTFTYTGDYKPLIDLLEKGDSTITIKGDDLKLHNVSAAKTITLLAAANAIRLHVAI